MIAFLATSAFSFLLQNRISITDTEYMLNINIANARNAINSKYKSNEKLDNNISNLALDWHIEENGCIIISDKNDTILSDQNGHIGEKLTENGINLNNTSIKTNTIFSTDIYGENSFCMYSDEGNYYIIAYIPKNEVLFSRRITLHLTIFINIIVFTSLFINNFFLIKKLVVKDIDRVNNSLSKITMLSFSLRAKL